MQKYEIKIRSNDMKKAVKLSLIQLCESVLELHIEVLKLKNMEEIISCFSMCQDGAVVIGQTLEKEEVSYDTQIQTLECYCDDLFSLAQKQTLDLVKFKEMTDSINGLCTFIRQIPHILEVAFYPYQAAMWDSLESVYTAFSKRKDCHCTVVPIPYSEYQKKDDTWHPCYDGHRMPFMIPITSYKEYDVAVHQPDIAFIHNPYDELNFVTRVDEMFYSHNLKKYVGTLIYIPYYATSGESTTDLISDTSAHHYVDAFIVQTDEIKKSYEKMPYYTRIAPLGSPKFDKIVQYCRDGGHIPLDWKPILEGKKTLMLNTTIAPFLKFNEHVLDKLLYIFQTIEQRDDVALIWRPHPLLESTIHSMRPEMQRRYEEVTRYFIEHKIGVLDKTPDITNTVALCDGYIGDYAGSVPILFSIAEKPIFILNYFALKEPTEIEKRAVLLWNIVKGDDTFFALAKQHGGLFQISSDMKTISYLGNDAEDDAWRQTYATMIQKDNKLYIAPMHGKYLSIYDPETNAFEHIKEKEVPTDRWVLFRPYKDNILCFSIDTQELMIYSTKSKKWRSYTIAIPQRSEEDKRSQTPLALNKMMGFDMEKLFFNVKYSNEIVIFDLITKKQESIKIGDISTGYYHTMQASGHLWLFNAKNEIIRYHMETKKIQSISIPKEQEYWNNISNNDHAYGSKYFFEDVIIILPAFSNGILKVDKNTLEGRLLLRDLLKPEWEEQRKLNKVLHPTIGSAFRLDDEHIVFHLRVANRFIKMNVLTEEIEEFEFPLLSDADYERFIKDLDKDTYGFEKWSKLHYFYKQENIHHSFADFCADLASDKFDALRPIQQKYNEEIANNLDGSCGEKICDFALQTHFSKYKK